MSTAIEWTDEVWNPVTGCTRVSEGCRNCYIERTPPFRIAGRKFVNGSTGITLHPDRLEQPLRWKRPRRVFVNSLSDLFHEDVPDEFIVSCYAVMVAASWHTFQILTKRPERRRYLLSAPSFREWVAERAAKMINALRGDRSLSATETLAEWNAGHALNIHEGVSGEDQKTADERIAILQRTPAAVRFVSAEPMLGPVDLESIEWPNKGGHRVDVLRRGYWNQAGYRYGGPSAALGAERGCFTNHSDMNGLDWVIVGGESGPGARPCDVAWIRSIVEQCQAAGVPVFVKQLGSRPYAVEGSRDAQEWGAFVPAVAVMDDRGLIHCKDKKGGDPSEWPADLRVREFPR